MKGLTVTEPGAPYELTTELQKPTPGPKQVLVKSLYTAINPVETFMQSTGLLVTSWPAVIGCDASGIIVDVGEGVTKFKKGDAVFGCTRLGIPGYCTFQEYFLMDEYLALLKPHNISLEQAAGIGVGVETACLGLISGVGLRFPEKGEHPKFDEWIVILGGSGSVGQYAVQIAKICGYKVLASCSTSNENFVKSVGADATFDYKLDLPSQLSHVESITGGNFIAVFDTTAQSVTAAVEFLTKGSKSKKKSFATVDDWTPMETPPELHTSRIILGQIGRSGPKGEETSSAIAGFIPHLERLLADGTMKPQAVQLVSGGFEAVAGAVAMAQKGVGGGKKVVVHIADPDA